MKGIIFAGDSFTWGQGLYFYSELPRLFYPPFNQYIGDNVTKSHRLFKNTKSFTRLVSNYFNTPQLKVFTDSLELVNYLKSKSYHQSVLLMMSSGNFDGIDFKELSLQLHS